MIKLYEIDWGAEPFYWDVYDGNDDFMRVVDSDEFDEYLDFLRSQGVDFTLYTLDWYEQHLALGRS